MLKQRVYDLENKNPELIPTSIMAGKSLKDSRRCTTDEEAEKEADFTFGGGGGGGGGGGVYALIPISCE